MTKYLDYLIYLFCFKFQKKFKLEKSDKVLEQGKLLQYIYNFICSNEFVTWWRVIMIIHSILTKTNVSRVIQEIISLKNVSRLSGGKVMFSTEDLIVKHWAFSSVE